jgi:hypothetical protein
MKLQLRLFLAMALSLMSPYLWAGYLGQSVGLTYEETAMVATDYGVKVVGPNTEFIGVQYFDIDVSDRTIRLSFMSGFSVDYGYGSYGYEPFSGFHLRDGDGTLPDIVGVSIGLDSHFGLDASRLSFDENDIFVNLSGLTMSWASSFSGFCLTAPGFCFAAPTYDPADQPELVLNVQFAEVPEPISLATTILGLLAVASIRRRQVH